MAQTSFRSSFLARKILSFYSSEDANLLSLYFDEYNYTQASSHLSEQSLFGGKNILYVKSDKKIPAKELKRAHLALFKEPGQLLFYLSFMRPI